MFDTKSSFILSKLGIQRFQPQEKKLNSKIFFGVLWGDILTLLDKSFNELDKNELELLTKIIKALSDDKSEYKFSREINNLDELSIKPRLAINFTYNKPIKFGHITTVVQTKPLHLLADSLDDKKKLWRGIKEFKNESSAC